MKYVALLRGVNVGGKNKVPMGELRSLLTKAGFNKVRTYIASGNVLLESNKSATTVARQMETLLVTHFKLDSELIKVLVLKEAELQAVITNKPKGFGDKLQKFHSDVIFLIGVEATKVMPVFKPKAGVDRVWAGKGVIYSERLSVRRTESRLSIIVSSPFYQNMTIRNWNTTTKLLALMKDG